MTNFIQPSQVSAWVNRYFPDHKLRKGGEQIRINNPFVYDDDYHLEISTTKLVVNDFRGNSWIGVDPVTGNRRKCTFLRFVQLYLTKIRGTCSYRKAVEDVAGMAASYSALAGYRKPEKEAEQNSNLKLPDGSKPINTDDPDVLEKIVLNYLHKKRGLTNEKIAKYQMMSSGTQIVWPYYEFDELVYYQSRSIVNKKFQYPPESVGVTKGQFLYGFDLVEPAGHITITEAFIDCQTLEEQCIATGGGNMTPAQAVKLRLLNPSSIVLAPDNDEAGIKSILYNAKLLDRFIIYYSIPPKIEYKDEAGETKLTKDWNDILVNTSENPLHLMEKGIQRLGAIQKLRLTDLISSR